MEIINFEPQDHPICITWKTGKSFELDFVPDVDDLEYGELLLLKVNLESEIARLDENEPKRASSEAHENWEDAHEDLEDILDDVLDRLEELSEET